ncbi:MAG: hypothetical protein ABH878_07585, partial [bacterium]
MKLRRFMLWGFPLLCCTKLCLALDSDSLQIRLFHGLDEMGTTTSFLFHTQWGTMSTRWQASSLGLFHRPFGSQGEVKTNGAIKGEITQALRQNLNVQAILEGDYYRFQPLQGPLSQPLLWTQPASTWSSPASGGGWVLQPQRIDRSLLALGSTFQPDTFLKLTSMLGEQWDKREGLDDQGWAASLEAELNDLRYKGYNNNLDLLLEREALGERLNRDFRFQYGLDKVFTESSSDRLELYYRQKKQDYYHWSSSSIGTRVDTYQSFRNQLDYSVNPVWKFSLDTELIGSAHEDRTLFANTIRDEINTGNALTLYGLRNRLSGWLRLKLEWGAQEDATGLKRERGTTLEHSINWAPTLRDSLNFVSAVRKKQYDTSDTANYDDRDRLRYEFDLHYKRAFHQQLKFSVRAQTILEHLVYIYAEKSDLNNWNRILKLTPEISYSPDFAWQNLARFELVANTTDYDFELDPANIKSTIYRRYSAFDSLTWEFQRNWSISIEAALDLEDGGRLLWNEWIQQIA